MKVAKQKICEQVFALLIKLILQFLCSILLWILMNQYSHDPNTGHSNTGHIRIVDIFEIRFSDG